jgi:hypothetical protein
MSKNIVTWDYEIITPLCQYEVIDEGTISGVGNCSKPAIYKMWWDITDSQGVTHHDEMFLCKKHFKGVRKAQESKSNARP